MIDVSFLYCGRANETVAHRYGGAEAHRGNSSSIEKKPIVVWNITRRCNLRCKHCYSGSAFEVNEDELTNAEAKKVIDDLADFGVPVILFSGGEPLMREDVFELIAYANEKNIRTVLSTNGTLINEQIADVIAAVGVSYVGISIDSAHADVHNQFRGSAGAFEKAIRAIEILKKRNRKAGMRVTLIKFNADDLEGIFELAGRLQVDRLCFYHLVPVSGAERTLALSKEQTRIAIEKIFALTERYIDMQVLTVDNHCDGAFLYLKLKEKSPEQAEKIYGLLKRNAGAGGSSGVGIACIDWSGGVHIDQFSMDYTIGNVREKSFGEIWRSDDELLSKLRNRKSHITGRCSACRFFDICGGGLRSRAKLITGDFWASEPDCYLSDDEISGDVK